jgi:ubiquinone/menaquinone biosynthesis C-methylase UbiE
MEKLPFADQSFDIIVSAGSLSYGDNDIVMNEIYRVLKNKGMALSKATSTHQY